jgi:hypothetical protein
MCFDKLSTSGDDQTLPRRIFSITRRFMVRMIAIARIQQTRFPAGSCACMAETGG